MKKGKKPNQNLYGERKQQRRGNLINGLFGLREKEREREGE